MQDSFKFKKTAIIAGVTGQDGSYLAEFLLENDYFVHGIIRRSSSFNTGRVDHLMSNKNFKLHYGDVTDPLNISRLISEIQPDEVYNLAAQSHVKVSFEEPFYTGQVDALGTLNILEAIKNHCPNAKFYQASTSELYGGLDYNRPESGYNEESHFHPRSPYGVAKLYGYWIVKNYREAYNLFAVNGILFNHGSERRGLTFVERKITHGFAEIKLGRKRGISLGNLDAMRDIGHAKEYVYGMWLMLQQENPEDFVLATGKAYSVRQLCEIAAREVGIEIEWHGSGLDEIGIDKRTGQILVTVDEKYFRPSEVDFLLGDSSKAREFLGWCPEIDIYSLISGMVRSDLDKLQNNEIIHY